MTKAVAAIIHGLDYQARLFWIQVCRMFEDRPKVIKVEIESDNVKSLDDIVVHYDGLYDLDDPIKTDYFQVKFHVTAAGAFSWKGMMDPKFINASSVSLLQRIHHAQKQFAPDGMGCRFNIYSPWTIHPDDEMARLYDQTDGRIRLSELMKGSAQSKMGKIRDAWRKHLGLASDQELIMVLKPIRIQIGPTLDELANQLNLHLQCAGLKPAKDGAGLNHYDDLAQKMIQRGRTSFSRKEIEEVCRREGLWVGRIVAEPNAFRLGIRSFLQFAENLEDETDATLCLLHHFDGRAPRNSSLWNDAIASDVEAFLREKAISQRPYHIRLQSHGSIAFVAGWLLPPKAGVDIVPVQYSLTGRHIWRAETISPEIEKRYSMWQFYNSRLEYSQGADTILAISSTHEIRENVLIYARQNIISAGHFIHCRLPNIGSTSIADGSHALLLAQNIISSVRDTLSAHPCLGRLHIFFSAPNGLLFIIGRMARIWGNIILYEHDFEAGGAAYQPSISLPLPRGAGNRINSKLTEDE